MTFCPGFYLARRSRDLDALLWIPSLAGGAAVSRALLLVRRPHVLAFYMC
jgi:hypothetical protein